MIVKAAIFCFLSGVVGVVLASFVGASSTVVAFSFFGCSTMCSVLLGAYQLRQQRSNAQLQTQRAIKRVR